MLNKDSLGIQKYILDRLSIIYEEVLKHDPEFQELGEKPDQIFKTLCAKLPEKIIV